MQVGGARGPDIWTPELQFVTHLLLFIRTIQLSCSFLLILSSHAIYASVLSNKIVSLLANILQEDESVTK